MSGNDFMTIARRMRHQNCAPTTRRRTLILMPKQNGYVWLEQRYLTCVSSELRMKLTGHKSAEIHSGYTHSELETLKDAIKKLPGLRKAKVAWSGTWDQ